MPSSQHQPNFGETIHEPWSPQPIGILYQDNHLLVVQKPAGVLSQEDVSGDPDIIRICKAWRIHKEQKSGNAFVGLIHRLDRNVEGVMVLAKTSKAASRLSAQIRARTVRKEYLAWVHGTPSTQGTLEGFIHKDGKTNRSSGNNGGGDKTKRARLHYKRLFVTQDIAHQDKSLLRVELVTGRSHQIRVQFAEAGHPLVGDTKYGAPRSSTQRRSGTPTQGALALLAWRFSCDHPTQGHRLMFQSSMPNRHPWSTLSMEHLPG
jgi:23S rRNA pseudouridine1911/1915/1917 synthase